MSYFWTSADKLTAVLSKLASNPLFMLKPVSTWKESDPLYFQLFLLIILIIFTYYQTKRTDDCSWVDRLWSICPIIYASSMLIHYYINNQEIHERLALVFLCIFGWGARLSMNLHLKNGYKTGNEDHRWRLIRTWFQGNKRLRWELFVLFFINIYQMISIFLFSALPVYIIYYGPNKMQMYDLPVTILFSFFLIIETFADFQMYEFQEGKKERIRKREFSQKGDDIYLDGYYCNGLYKYSRHPNYFGELGQWICIYIFTCINCGVNNSVSIGNWSIFGLLNLFFIFYKSMNLTEGITSFKYPKYKYYARRTSQLILWKPTPEKLKDK